MANLPPFPAREGEVFGVIEDIARQDLEAGNVYELWRLHPTVEPNEDYYRLQVRVLAGRRKGKIEVWILYPHELAEVDPL